MIIEKIASVNLESDNGDALYVTNQTYYFRQNNFDVLNMEITAISFSQKASSGLFPISSGAGFFITLVDKNKKILLDSYPLQALWNGDEIGTGVDYTPYPVKRFNLHDVDLQKSYFKFSKVPGGAIYGGLIGTFQFYLISKKTTNNLETWQQSI
jgi:hypothetical protein